MLNVNNTIFTIAKEETEKAAGGQDKRPPWRSTAASRQPVTAAAFPVYSTKHHGSEKRQTVVLSGRVLPEIDEAYATLARERGAHWTKSSLAALALEEWLIHNMGEKLAQRIVSAVTEAIDQNMQRRENRLASILSKIFYAIEAFRLFLFKVLNLCFVAEQDILLQLQQDAERDAGVNIAHKQQQEGSQWQS